MISEELVFPWLDLKRCRQSLYYLPYNHHQLFDNGTLSNLGAENSHRRNISRAAMLLPIFQFFFLQWAIIIYKILIIQSKKLQKNLHTLNKDPFYAGFGEFRMQISADFPPSCLNSSPQSSSKTLTKVFFNEKL